MKCPMCGEEEVPVHIILKCSETKLWSAWGHFGNEILVMKISNIRNK
jgi:hypothetical protein